MNNYFLLSWKHKPELASAFALQKVNLDHELIMELEGKTTMPFDFEIKKISEGKNGLIINNELGDLKEIWLDYQPNNLAWPLMSEKLKVVIEKNLTGNEGVDWLVCKVNCKNEWRTYYILRFNKMQDVLDNQRTIFVQGTEVIIKPVFSLNKIKLYNIFTTPNDHNLWKITPGLYISESLKKAIQREKITGVDFEKTSVA